MPEIVITEFMDEAAVARLSAGRETLYDPALVDDPVALAAALAEARALVVRNRTQVDAALLSAAPRLACVGRLGVGLDNIDLDAAAARGVTVYPATGANDRAVAEYVVMAAMALLRPALFRGAEMRAGAWPRAAAGQGREAADRTLGLIGYGAIARQTAARARALGMTVIAHDPHLAPDDPAWAEAERVALPDLLARADAVSLHVPLTPATRHLIGTAELARMRADAVLINAARGGVVDEAALAEALRAGRLAGAALDVFETEPLTAAAAARFDGLENLILTPHIAGVTRESNARVSDLIASRVLAHLAAA